MAVVQQILKQIGAREDVTLPQDEFGDILRILEPDFFTSTALTQLFADDDLTTDGRVNVARLLHKCDVDNVEMETEVKEDNAASTKQNETALFGNLHSETNGNKPRVLFVSENLPMFELLVEAAKDGTAVVPVKYNSWTLDDLTENTLMRLGMPKNQFASIALMDHGKQGGFCLLKSVGEQDGMVNLKTIQANPGLQKFLKLLGQYVHNSESQDFRQDLSSRIDLLACDVAAGDGAKLVEYLEDVTQVNWAASTNPTGTTEGSDWVMETEKGLGAINNCYFDNEKLAKWNYQCGFCVQRASAGTRQPISVHSIPNWSDTQDLAAERWHQRVKGMTEDRWASRVCEWQPLGFRQRGRPSTQQQPRASSPAAPSGT